MGVGGGPGGGPGGVTTGRAGRVPRVLRPPDELVRTRPLDLRDALLCYLGGIVASVMAGGIAGGLGDWNRFEDFPGAVRLALIPALWIGLVALPLVILRRRKRDPVADLRLSLRPVDLATGAVAGVVLQVAAIPALYWVLQLVVGDLDVDGPAKEVMGLVSGFWPRVALVLVVAVGAPIAEEFFFRGVFQGSVDRLLRGGGWPTQRAGWGAVGTTSVIFAATHFQMVQFPGLLLAGLVFGLLAQRSGRLGPALVAHVMFNLVALLVGLT